ncbi:hypothetical protein, partial [Salmonella enterica]|uniref:hypothetical protein n=1 Tax=Salmonella enterica TaxID=28901 RepID=UPI0020C26A7B
MAQHKRYEAATIYAARAKPKQRRYNEKATGGLDKMIDYHSILVSALNTILPTYYEMALHKGIETP